MMKLAFPTKIENYGIEYITLMTRTAGNAIKTEKVRVLRFTATQILVQHDCMGLVRAEDALEIFSRKTGEAKYEGQNNMTFICEADFQLVKVQE